MRRDYTLSLDGKSIALGKKAGRALLMIADPCKEPPINGKVAALLLVTIPLTPENLVAAGAAGILEGLS